MIQSPIIGPIEKLGSPELFEVSSRISCDPIELYRTGLSIRQVAEKIGWSWSKTQSHLSRAKVTRSVGEGVHLATRAPLFPVTEELIELVDGLLLGDGSIEANQRSGRLAIGQSGKHRPWITDLRSHFHDLNVVTSLQYIPGGECTIKGRTCTRRPRVNLRTADYPWFLTQRHRWYSGSTKIIPADVRLTPLSLAGWFCGDGIGKAQVEFCTEGFPPENVQRLARYLRAKFNWAPKVTSKNRISLGKQTDRSNFLTMIEPLVPDCFNHKLGFKTSKSKYSRLSQEQLLQLKELRGQGWKVSELARYFSKTQPGIYGAMEALGIHHPRARTATSRSC